VKSLAAEKIASIITWQGKADMLIDAMSFIL
jgi:hypothetical protein